jgi:hypothetical protein
MNGGRGNIYTVALAVTAPVAYTATALSGPLLYNGSTNRGVVAHLLALSFGLTTASTAAAVIGIAGGATTAPSSTSTTGLITSNTTLRSGAPTPQCTLYATGTVSTAATLWLPVGQIDTAALTAQPSGANLVHLGGVISAAPGNFLVPLFSATLSTAVIWLSMTWMEVPVEA